MARRTDHSREELETLILNASWHIIKDEGFDSLTARRVAQKVGYSPGTLYNLFSSMDDLHLRINARILNVLYEILNDPAHQNPDKTSEENIISMAEAYMKFAQDYRPYWHMLFRMQQPSASRKTDAPYQEKIAQLFEPLEKLLHPFFKDHEHVQRKRASHSLWAAIHGLCFLQETGKIPLVSPDATAAIKMSTFLIETFVAGLRPSR